MAAPFACLEPRTALTVDDYVRDIAWAADGRSLAVAGGEGQIFLVAGLDQEPVARSVGAHLPGALALAWAPGTSRFATSGQDGSIALWDGASGAELKRWQPASTWTEQLAWSPDAGLLASAAGRTASLWTMNGEPAAELAAHTSTVAALGWDRSGRDLGAATHGGVRVHRLEPARGASPVRAVGTRDYTVAGACLTVAFSPNGKVLATGMLTGAVQFWYLATGKSSAMSGYRTRVAHTAWSANGRYLATAAGPDIVLWDFAGKGPEGTRPITLGGHTERVESLVWQPGGPHLVSGGRDWRLSLWLPSKTTRAIDAHLAEDEVTVVRWSPDGQRLAVGGARGALALYALVPPA